MGKSKKPKMQVSEYWMSVHFGICAGPVDAVEGIYVGEKTAWEGEQTAEGGISISKRELFGGIKKEGGLEGVAYYLPGGTNQEMPSGLASRLGRTTETCPGFRGLSSLFFVKSLVSDGFYWTANSPYLRGVWAKVRRASVGLTAGIAMIGPDSNPAHMIYECLTNTDWGMGASASAVDTPAFEACAQTLFDEGFGLSMIWTRQASIESFIGEILDHIQATLFLNPRTGLLTLKLIRGDYDVETLPELDPDNCTVTSFQRKAWGETVNEIVVTWTNPANEQDETVTMQDLANISMQGSLVSDSRDYYGVRNSDLAMELCARDLRAASAPLSSCEVTVDRSAWDLLPGGVVKLTYPEYGLSGLVLRIVDIDYGKPGQGQIKLSLVEDIFTLPTSAYVLPPSSDWVDTSEDPAAMTHVQLMTVPAFMTGLIADAAVMEYPEVFAGVLAAQPGNDTLSFELVGEVTKSNGDIEMEALGTKMLAGRCLLTAALDWEAESLVVEFSGVIGGEGPVVAGFVILGSGTDEDLEICLIKSADESGWVLARGVLDTVPRAWPIGTPAWFVDEGTLFYDETDRSAFDEVDFQLQSRTSKGLLELVDAPIETITLTERPHLPNRPGNVQADAVGFGTLELLDALPTDEIAVTWANRNRTMEDSQVVEWADATVTPESGQTTTVTVLSDADAELTSYTALTGTSHNVPVSAFSGERSGKIRVTSERDGLVSLQAHEIPVTIDYHNEGIAEATFSFTASATGTIAP